MLSVCAQWLWWESWICSERGYIISQCALAATALMGGTAGVGWARDRARCVPGLLPGSMAVSVLLGGGVEPEGLEQES